MNRCTQKIKGGEKYFKQFYGLLSGIGNAVEKILSKYMTTTVQPQYVLIGRGLSYSVFTIPMIFCFNVKLMPVSGEAWKTFARSSSHAFGLNLFYHSFIFIPYFEGLIIMYGTLIISTVIISKFFLSQDITYYKYFCAALIITGLLMTCIPQISAKHHQFTISMSCLGYIMAFLSGIIFGVSTTINRFITETSPLTIGLYCGFFDILFGGLVCFVRPLEIPEFSLNFVMCLSGLGLLTVIYFNSMIRGCQVMNLVRFILTSQVVMPAALLLQIIFLHQVPHIVSIIGGIVTLCGIILIILESSDVIERTVARLNCCKSSQNEDQES